jgi:hypothetical protein
MPRTTGDLTYERNESAALALSDQCNVIIAEMGADAGGGRNIVAGYNESAVPCRVEFDHFDERGDDTGYRTANYYWIYMASDSASDEGWPRNLYEFTIRIFITFMSGVSVSNRSFLVVAYGRSAEMNLRKLYCVEEYLA